MNSACGWDRVSYWLIKKYWVYIGPVLKRCANESFNEGELSPTFRTGMIKRIPKKGDARKLRIGDLLCYFVADIN